MQSVALGRADAALSPNSGRIDDRPAIAVLPFVNFGDDPEQEYFADGVAEDIISMLAGWRAFPVIARDSTFTFKGQASTSIRSESSLARATSSRAAYANPTTGYASRRS